MPTCKDCQHRRLHCHSECANYIEWKQEHERLNELKKEPSEFSVNRYKRYVEKLKKKFGKNFIKL